MSWLFGSSKTPAELMREHQRTLQRSMRELDRERGKLEQQEVKLKADIKKSAKAGQMVRHPSHRPRPLCRLATHPPHRRRPTAAARADRGVAPQSAAKIMAKDMVRTRRYIQKFHQMHAQLQAVSLRMQVRGTPRPP
jgi:charged multivesicular body protein 2A